MKRGVPPGPNAALDRFADRRGAGCFTFHHDEAGWTLAWANPAFRTQFDLPAAGMEGEPLAAVIGGETGADIQRCLDECLVKNRPLSRRISLHRGEETLWVMVEMSPEVPAANEPGGACIHGTAIDMTKTARADAALTSATGFDHYVTHSADHLSEPVVIADVTAEGIPIIHVNAAFSRAFGYSRYEVIGRDPIHLLFSGQAESVTDAVERAWKDGLPTSANFRASTKQGSVVPCQVVFDFYRGEGSQIYLLRMTVLANRPESAPPLAPADILRLEADGLLGAARAIINDFNNLLAVVMAKERLLSKPADLAREDLNQSKRAATEAANIVFELLTSSGAARSERVPTKPFVSTGAAPDRSAASLAVLVIDDEPFIRNMMAQCLTFAGFQVTTAGSGEEALGIMDRDPTAFSCLVVDFTLTGVSGLEVLQILREHNVPTPVVLVSGYFGEAAERTALQLGGVELLGKPFQPDELLTAVNRVLHAAGL